MQYKNFLLVTILMGMGSVGVVAKTEAQHPVVNFFDKQLLKDTKRVRQELYRVGFEDVTIDTIDGYRLSGLLLLRPQAEATVVVVPGFWPGNKELHAPLMHVFPEDTNILLLDQRGRGQSSGSFITGLHRYGVYEYLDVVAALTYARNVTQVPLIIYGCCAGAFNTAHALINMGPARVENMDIKGFIFDSGWATPQTALACLPLQHMERIMTPLITQQSPLLARFVTFAGTSHLLKPLQSYFGNQVQPYEPITSLFNKIKNITVPVLFVHSEDDDLTPLNHVTSLAQTTPHALTWIIPRGISRHAQHPFYVPQQFEAHMHAFCRDILND